MLCMVVLMCKLGLLMLKFTAQSRVQLIMFGECIPKAITVQPFKAAWIISIHQGFTPALASQILILVKVSRMKGFFSQFSTD